MKKKGKQKQKHKQKQKRKRKITTGVAGEERYFIKKILKNKSRMRWLWNLNGWVKVKRK